MRTEDRTGASLPAAPGGGPARPAALPLLPTLESAWPALCALVAGLCLWLWAGAIGDVNPREINDIGLASVLPGAVLFALVLLTVSCWGSLPLCHRTLHYLATPLRSRTL